MRILTFSSSSINGKKIVSEYSFGSWSKTSLSQALNDKKITTFYLVLEKHRFTLVSKNYIMSKIVVKIPLFTIEMINQ